VHYNIYFLLGNIIGVPLIGVRRRRHPSMWVCIYVCMHILLFHIVTEKKNDHSGWVPWSEKKFLHIRVCMYFLFFFFSSSARWTVKIRINLRIKKTLVHNGKLFDKEELKQRRRRMENSMCAAHICWIFVFS